jgi:hypothetical protein
VNEINDTLEEVKMQAQRYIDTLLETTSANLQEAALQSGAITKIRELKEAKHLLQLLLIYAVSDVSLRAISVIASEIAGINISDTAWRKRFLKCGAFVCLLLNNALANVAVTQLWFYYQNQKLQVFLLDATTFKQVGKNGEEIRVHMCYNLTKGAMQEVIVTDNHTAESAALFTVMPGCLYIGDAGYGKGKNMAYIVENEGNVLFRFTPNLTKLAMDAKGKRIVNMAKRLKSKKNKIQFHCYIQAGKDNYIPVRIMASRLPEDKALLAKERKIKTSKRKQQQVKEETLIYCQWVILLTNLDSSYDMDSLFRLYRSRWQIELLFKRIKQFLKVNRLKKASLEHSKVLVLTMFLAWSLVEREALQAEIQLLEQGEDMEDYSPWVATSIAFLQFKTTLNSSWALGLDIKRVIRTHYHRLRNHKSQRANQYTSFRHSQISSLSCRDVVPSFNPSSYSAA